MTFKDAQHLPGMPAWLFEYNGPDGVYGIVLNGADPQAIIAEHCDSLPDLRLLGLHGGTVVADDPND